MTLQEDIHAILAAHLAPALADKLAMSIIKRAVQSVAADRAAVRERVLAAVNSGNTAPKRAKAAKAVKAAPTAGDEQAAPKAAAQGTRNVGGPSKLRMPLLKRIQHATTRAAAGKPQAADTYLLENAQNIREGNQKILKGITSEVKRLLTAAEKAEKDTKKAKAVEAKTATQAAKAAKRAKDAPKAVKAAPKAKTRGKKAAAADDILGPVSSASNGATRTVTSGNVSAEILL
jgi:hypothetical protein